MLDMRVFALHFMMGDIGVIHLPAGGKNARKSFLTFSVFEKSHETLFCALYCLYPSFDFGNA